MFGLPTIYDSNDPRNRTLRVGALACAGLFIVAVVILQQHVRIMHEMTTSRATSDARHSEAVFHPNIGAMEIECKIAVKWAALERKYNGELVNPLSERTGAFELPMDGMTRETVDSIDAMAVSRTERLRAALVVAEFAGAGEAVRRLTALSEEAGADSAITADAQWFTLVYQGRHAEITPEAKGALVARHGWYARLAFTWGEADNSADRWPLVQGAEEVARFMFWFYLLMAVSFVIGIGLAVWGIVLFAGGVITSTVAESADDLLVAPVYLETFAIFAGGMMLFMLVAAGGVTVRDHTLAVALLSIGEVISWTLLIVPLWPLLRGVDWSVLREDLGLAVTGDEPEDVVKEMGWGVVAWAAGMPLSLLLGMLVTWLGDAVSAGAAVDAADEYPMFEPPLADSWVLVMLGVIGSVAWAPVIEEVVFRGAVHRWLRPSLGPLLTILCSSVLFAVVHPYSSAGLIQVAFGGLMYGIVREWRGSLVPSMVAHCLHNATIEASTVSLLVMLGD